MFKYKIWCELEVPYAQDPSIPILYTHRPMANRSLFAKFEVRSTSRWYVIMITTDGRTDGQTDIAQTS